MAADSDRRKYFDLIELVREKSNADGAIVIILKGDQSRIAPDLPPEMLPYLPEILHNCASQSAIWLAQLAEELRPEVESLMKKRN